MAVQLDRVKIPERPPAERVKSYDEAVLGYTRKLAVAEALRCIDCKTKPCTYACPALTKAPEYIQAIAGGDFDKSLAIALETYPLPGTLGRTCFHPCEDSCVVGFKGEPVASHLPAGQQGILGEPPSAEALAWAQQLLASRCRKP